MNSKNEFCPNINLEEYKFMVTALDGNNELATYCWYHNGGQPIWLNPDGSESTVYQDLFHSDFNVNSMAEAIKIKSWMYTKDFLDRHKDLNAFDKRPDAIGLLKQYRGMTIANRSDISTDVLNDRRTLLSKHNLIKKDGSEIVYKTHDAALKVAQNINTDKTIPEKAFVSKFIRNNTQVYNISFTKRNAFTTSDGDVTAFYDKESGEITLTSKGLTAETVIHEFAHPFIDSLEVNNKELFDNLVASIKSDENVGEIKSIIEHVEANYSESDEVTKNKELLAYVISEYGKGNIDPSKGTNTASAIERFFKWVSSLTKDLIQQITKDKTLFVDQIHPNTNYKEVSDLFTVMAEVGNINLGVSKISPESLKPSDDVKKANLEALLAKRRAAKAKEQNNMPPAYKVIKESNFEFVDVTNEADHMSSLLPESIVTNIVEGYVRVLSGGRKVTGMFQNAMITLSKLNKKGTAYHEGFHAVFRSLLSEEQQNELHEEALSLFTNPTPKDLLDLQMQYGISNEEALKLYTEEILADEFASFMDGNQSMYSGGIKGFFQKLADWIKGVFSSETKVRALFSDIKLGKYKNTVPNIVTGVAYKSHGVFSASEVITITKELTSVAFKGINTLDDLKVRPASMQNVEDSILDSYMDAIDNDDMDLANNIEAILNEDNTGIDSFWMREIDSYMRNSLGLKVKSNKVAKEKIDESDSEESNAESVEKDGFILNSYEVSGKTSATAAVKFMIAMTNKVSFVDPLGSLTIDNLNMELSQYTGLPILSDYGSLYNNVENYLADVVAVKVNGENQDGLLVMLEALKSHVKYKPELVVLIDKLENASEEVRSQFFGAFSKQKGSYVHHQVVGDVKSGISSRFTSSGFSSKSSIIRDNWISNFNRIFGKNEEGRLVYDEDAVAGFTILRDAVSYEIANELDQAESNVDYVLDDTILDRFNYVLDNMGVELNPKTLNYLIESKLPANSDNYTLDYLNELQQLYFKFETSTNSIVQKTGTIYGANNQIQDNGSFFNTVLAEADSYFKEVPGENSFSGPGGSQIYTYQNNDSVSKAIATFKSGDLSFLEGLSKSAYSKNSVWIKELLDASSGKKNRDAFFIEMYGNLKSESKNQDTGEKASALDPTESYMDNINKTLSGYYIGLAEADKSKQTYFKGPAMKRAKDAKGIIKGYLADEISRMNIARAVVFGTETSNPVDENEWHMYYHFYSVAKGEGTIGKDLDKVPGNAFNSYLMPTINFDELGLLDDDGSILPLTDVNFYKNKTIDNLVGKMFKNLVISEIDNAVNLNVILKKTESEEVLAEDGSVETPAVYSYSNRLISQSIINKEGNNYKNGDKLNVNQIFADYVLNSMIGNIEQTKIFNGDPACYKVKGLDKGKSWASLDLFTDFLKRIPAVFASGKDFRMFKNKDGGIVVRDYYSSATIANIMTPSAFFATKEGFNEDNLKEVSTITKVPLDELKTMFKPYLEINQTDAQAWITLDAYKERMSGLGKWTPKHEEAYNKMNNGESVDALELGMFAQPLKTVHSELVPTANKEYIMHYNKQSEAVLLPFMKNTKLSNLMNAMEDQDIDHVIVLDGKKSGASGVEDVMEDGEIKSSENINLNPIYLSYNNLFLQQDLPAKHIKDTTVGSQGTKNVMSVVSLEEKYFKGKLGQEVLDLFHETIGRISDLGLIDLDKEVGYDTEKGGYDIKEGNKAVRQMLQREFEGDVSENVLNALDDDIALDAIPIKNKIMNKLMAVITKKTVKLKQSGGALIQLSDLGFIASEVNLSDKVKNGIIWFKDPSDRLSPMSIHDGEVRAAQVLIPHSEFIKMLSSKKSVVSMLEEKFGVSDYRELSHKDIISVMSKSIMEGFSYRIPNQAAASNDAFEIVGVLPIEMGDTMVSFSDITVKTGSDFDIDKAYIMLPNFFFNDKSNKIEKVQYNMDDMGSNRLKALQNLRLDLMRQMLLHPAAYTSVMSPLDNPRLEDYTKKLFPAYEKLKDGQFFTGSFQMGVKAIFDEAKTLVGSIANHMTHNSLVQADNLSFNDYYFGKGIKNKAGSSVLSNTLDESGNSISQTLGLFMNAIVDAAKDPFIIRANINQYTANTAFTMIRAGVDMEWTVAFISQPIIKSVIKAQKEQEGRFGTKVRNSSGARMKTVESVIKAYGLEVSESEFRSLEKYPSLRSSSSDDITITKEDLEANLTEENKDSLNFKNGQLKILKQFLEWQKASSNVNDLMKICKTDVNGATRTLMSANLIKNLTKKVLREGVIVNANKTLGMDLEHNEIVVKKGAGSSMIGRYFNNSVLASLDRFSGLFIAGSNASQQIVENIALQAGYEELLPGESEEQLSYEVSNEVYAFTASKTKAFNISQEDLHTLLYGEKGNNGYGTISVDSLSGQLEEAKKGSLKDNLLINGLQISISKDNSPNKIYLPNNDTVKETKDSIYQAWEELLANPEHKQFGEDLIRYAFYASGFSKSVGDFYEHIPNSWLKKNGFNEEIKASNKLYESNYQLTGIEDMIIKNLHRNHKIVPVVVDTAQKAMVWTNYDDYIVDKQHGFLITQADSLNYTNGTSPDGTKVFKTFVKTEISKSEDVYGKETVNYGLFKRIGYTYNNDAIYIRVNKLGVTGKGNNIKEYFNDGMTSIFPENNVTLPKQLETIVRSVTDKSNASSAAFENLDIDNYDVSDVSDRIAFCILK